MEDKVITRLVFKLVYDEGAKQKYLEIDKDLYRKTMENQHHACILEANYYRLGTVNSKSFIGKILLRIKWKFELTVHFKHEMLGKW